MRKILMPSTPPLLIYTVTHYKLKLNFFRNLEKSDGLEYECRGYSEGTAFAIAYVNLIVIGIPTFNSEATP